MACHNHSVFYSPLCVCVFTRKREKEIQLFVLHVSGRHEFLIVFVPVAPLETVLKNELLTKAISHLLGIIRNDVEIERE